LSGAYSTCDFGSSAAACDGRLHAPLDMPNMAIIHTPFHAKIFGIRTRASGWASDKDAR
jgi:hypothetical protein